MITVYQINGQTVPPLADARLYELLSGGAVGVVLGCEVTSLGANQIRVGAGWIIIKGRCISVSEETIQATTSTSGTVDGRLLLHLDVSADETPATWITQAQTPLTALTQEDINGSGTIYEMPMATYQVDQLQVDQLQTVYPVAGSPAVYLYKATLLADNWTSAGSGKYTQTATLTAVDGGPAVTAGSVQMSDVMCNQTTVQETNETLQEVLGIVNGGNTVLGANQVTVTVFEVPEADVEAIWQIKQGVSS